MAGLFGGGSKPHNTQPPVVDTLRVQRSAYGVVRPILYGTNRLTGNVIWYGDFKAIAHSEQQSAGGKGGGGGAPATTSYTYTASFQMGLCEGQIAGIGSVWQDKAQKTAGSVISVVYYGQSFQTPWPYLLTNNPDKALGYVNLAYLGFANFDLGSSANLPNLSFEVQGPLQFGNGIVDAAPWSIIPDFLTKAAFPSAYVGSLDSYQAYTQAMGFFISPALIEARAANEILKDWATTTNSEFVWSDGILSIVPYGDTAVTGNGATYTPNMTPLYDLADDDFIAEPGNDPVTCTRKDLADAYNRFPVEFMNRANQYNRDTVTAEDPAHIDLYGLREASSITAHHVTSAATALQVAQLQMWRQLYVRAEYAFSLGWKHVLLEPMDLVTLTDPGLGLDRTLVRITEIEEDESGLLSVKAEEMPGALAAATAYATQGVSGYAADHNVAPSDTNPPILFDAPVEIADTMLEVWLAVSGGANWGGCDVWISSDGDTYRKVGTVHGGCRMGVSTIPLPAGQDPDTTHILGVDIATSGGQLLSGTTADADLYHTLCWFDGELISYQTAQLDDVGKYSLTYLRRGAFGTSNTAHAAGAKFARLDGGVFKYSYTKEQIGRTIYVKLASFNPFQGAGQDISTLTATPYVIQGPPPPPDVTGFGVSQKDAVVTFRWDPVSDYALKGYDIRYGAMGVADWSAMTPLTDTARGTEMTNASVPPGTWTFAIRARDVADQLSTVMTTQDLIVTNTNNIVVADEQAPDWPGTLSGFVKHWSGVLVPESTQAANLHTNAELFEQFVPYPVASAVYISSTVDTGFDASLRISATSAATLGRGAAGTPTTALAIDTWLTGQSDPDSFTSWTIGSASLRYLRARLTMTPSAGKSYLSAFKPTIDRANKTIDGGSTVAGTSGTIVTFEKIYHSIPEVTVTASGSTALIGTASDISTTQFTAHVFNTSGTEVGGAASWQATGV